MATDPPKRMTGAELAKTEREIVDSIWTAMQRLSARMAKAEAFAAERDRQREASAKVIAHPGWRH